MADLNPAASLPTPPPTFKDRRTGLLIFGILEILLGCLTALLVPLLVMGQLMAARMNQGAMSVRQIIPAMVVYGLIAALLITLGIGSCKARRWARALSLIVAWGWLAAGLFALGMMAFFLPKILSSAPPSAQPLQPSALLIVTIVSLAFMSLFMIVAPGFLVFFYQSRHVKITCEARDPRVRWTDACPLPVLGLSLWLAFGAASLLVMPLATRGVLPLFGVLVSGTLGTLCCVILAALWAYAAWSVYRLRSSGWWLTLLTVCVMGVSVWLTFTRVDVLQMYQLMGYPEEQLEAMRQSGLMRSSTLLLFSLSGFVPLLVYLLFVRRYFGKPVSPPASV